MKITSAFAGAVLANIMVFGASAGTLTITSVGTGNPDLGNVFLGGGYGAPWTTPILFTDSQGQTLVVFCDDLNHIVYVGGGQDLPYKTGLVTVDGLGNPLNEATSNVMGQLADIGRYDYLHGNEDGAIAAQAAIWSVEYGISASSSDSTIESDITSLLHTVTYHGGGYAFGLIPTDGTHWQAQITGVPELGTWAMMLVGFAGLGFAGYRRTKKIGGAKYALS
jgi:hypothetical protein